MELLQGRPLDLSGRLPREIAVYDLLDHLHINYHGIVDGFHYICTNSPKMGGIDSSPSAAHIVRIDEQKELSSFMTYWDERKFRQPEGALWSVKLPGEVLHSTPVVYENTLLVGLADDGWPKKSGVVRVDAAGKQLWFFPTKNSVKNDIAVENGVVFAQCPCISGQGVCRRNPADLRVGYGNR